MEQREGEVDAVVVDDLPSAELSTPAAPVSADLAADESPLRLTYEIEWNIDPTDPGYVLATVRLAATGGDGVYTFFRDETVTTSANFVYRWGSCKDNLGTFRVESADGQSTTVDYFEQPPCPDRGQSEANNP
jgi:hypothetical protein